jgi:hypothetical protein
VAKRREVALPLLSFQMKSSEWGGVWRCRREDVANSAANARPEHPHTHRPQWRRDLSAEQPGPLRALQIKEQHLYASEIAGIKRVS